MSTESIYLVDSLEVTPETDKSLKIATGGLANTGGWSSPALARRVNIHNDGIVEFDFVADKPTGTVTQGFASISVDSVEDIDAATKIIRVISDNNQMEFTVPNDGDAQIQGGWWGHQGKIKSR